MKRENWTRKNETSEFDLAFIDIMKGKKWTKTEWDRRKALHYCMVTSEDFMNDFVFAGARKGARISFEDLYIIISTFLLSGSFEYDEDNGLQAIENDSPYANFYMDALAQLTGHTEADLIARMRRYKEDGFVNAWDMKETEKAVKEIMGAMA